MSTRKEPPFFSLLPAIAFGYGAYRIFLRLMAQEGDNSTGIKALLIIGLVCSMLMTVFFVVGFWRSWRR